MNMVVLAFSVFILRSVTSDEFIMHDSYRAQVADELCHFLMAAAAVAPALLATQPDATEMSDVPLLLRALLELRSVEAAAGANGARFSDLWSAACVAVVCAP